MFPSSPTLETAPGSQEAMPATFTGNTSDEPEQSLELDQQREEVKQWCSRITAAKKKWEPDFKRMRKNMEFVSGLQWEGQTTIDDPRYVNNITLRSVHQKVATLYAKNPTTIATRRKRLDYQIWDESVESLTDAIMQAQQFVAAGVPIPMELTALFADYQAGQAFKKQIEKFCKTFEIIYKYQTDTQKPEFKEQMKQAVRRAVTCGVAFVRPIFCQEDGEYQKLMSTDTQSTVAARTGRIKEIVNKIDIGEIDETSPRFSELRSLIMSVGQSAQVPDEFNLPERLEFDCPLSTSIIVDERCRNLVDFVAARWIAQEYVLPVAEVNAVFGTKVKVGTGQGGAKEYSTEDGQNNTPVSETQSKDDPLSKNLVTVLEIFDYTTKTRCFVCDGWKDYLQPPEPVDPALSGFWNHFSLVFNNVEAEPGTKTSIYPPSDVQTMMSPQKEWNRTREALRDQRNANAPKYMVRKGHMTEADKRKIIDALPNEVVEVEGCPPDQNLRDFFVVFQHAPIDPALYDTAPLEQDLMLGSAMQQANVGPAEPNVTATVGNIAEQSRLNVSASNIDDLDGFLSRIAQAGGEMLLQRMSRDVVVEIVGPGAVWPEMPESRKLFLNQVYLEIESASSGRPNKAVDISNLQMMAPILQAAGANPVFIVEEAVRRLDDNLDVSRAFPLMQAANAMQGQPTAQGGNAGGKASPPTGAKPTETSSQPVQNAGTQAAQSAPLAGY